MATTQFLGAFNDNLFKQLILLLATPTAVELAAGKGTDSQSLAMVVFAVPFLLFSGIAGYVSDRDQQALGRHRREGRRSPHHAARLLRLLVVRP